MTIPWPDILLTLVGAVMGILVTLLSDEIKGWFGWSGLSNRDLRGEWSCNWQVEWPEGTRYETITDTVLVQRAGKRDVLARGLDIHGVAYDLRGSLSQANVFTLTFEATASRNLSGIVIVRLDIMRRRFAGYWLQVDPEGLIVGGRTTWTKARGI